MTTIDNPLDVNSDKSLVDYFDMEVNSSSDFFMEQTRYTTLTKMLETNLVKFHTQLSGEEIGIIMYIKAWSKAFVEFMKPVDTYRNLQLGVKYPMARDTPSIKTMRTIAMKQTEVIEFMELAVAKKGWRANGLLDVLKADEKAAKRSIFGSLFRKSDDGAVSERS